MRLTDAVGSPPTEVEIGEVPTVPSTARVDPSSLIESSPLAVDGRSAPDPTKHVSPHAEGAVDPEFANHLDGLSTEQPAAEVRDILEAAAAAVRRIAPRADVELPAWMRAPHLRGFPKILEGAIVRGFRRGRPRVQFRPDDPDIHSFNIPVDLTVGLPSGARVSVSTFVDGTKKKYDVVAKPEAYATAFLADVVDVEGVRYARGRGRAPIYGDVPLVDQDCSLVGKTILAKADRLGKDVSASVLERVGSPQSYDAMFLEVAANARKRFDFPQEVEDEVASLVEDPGIGELKEANDFTHIPFVTIDYASTQDLDQAVYVEKQHFGYRVQYAIADAAHFVQEGTALDREARRRLVTHYIPGRNIPMLPHALSEGLCSLSPQEDRRALIVTLDLDEAGNVLERGFDRGVIRSRAKLSFRDVQSFATGNADTFAGESFDRSLIALGKLGDKLIGKSFARGVTPSRPEGGRLTRTSNGEYVALERQRLPIEQWNEQISLLVNEEVGKKIADSGLLTLNRNHAQPEPDAIEGYRRKTVAIGLPWGTHQTLAQYLDGLPRHDERSAALAESAARINRRAKYGPVRSGHYGLKLEHYVHFTAPMRRYADIVSHRVLGAIIDGEPEGAPHQDPDELQRLGDAIVRVLRSDGEMDDACQDIYADRFLQKRLGDILRGQVQDIRPAGIEVRLDAQPISIVIPTRDLSAALGTGCDLIADGARLRCGDLELTLGETIDLDVVNGTEPGDVGLLPSSESTAAPRAA